MERKNLLPVSFYVRIDNKCNTFNNKALNDFCINETYLVGLNLKDRFDAAILREDTLTAYSGV